MNTDRKTLEQVAVNDMNEFDVRSCLPDVLIVSGDDSLAISIEKILNESLFRTSIAFDGDQVIEKLKDTWYNLILIDEELKKWNQMYPSLALETMPRAPAQI